MTYELTQSTIINEQSMKALDRYNRTTERVLRASEFKKLTGFTGQTAKREYSAYLKKAGQSGAVNISAKVQAKNMLVVKVKETAKGISVDYIHPQHAEPKLSRGRRSQKLDTSGIQAMTASELDQVIASAQAELAKR